MKVPYVEELANHSSPESCGGYGNVSAEALTGESVGRLSSSEITFFRVPTPCTEGEGHTSSSVNCKLLNDPAESKNPACVDALHTEIRRSERNPTLKSWNGGIQEIKTSRCIEERLYSMQAKNTKTGRKCWVGQRRCNAIRLTHEVSRKSDNNIVPEKPANKEAKTFAEQVE
ncbi:MAG: hypothetical protein KAI59_03125, partial [Planctomycetes bacterium]|nr:hypothetical protein [Planctomycetota bacterium]